MRIRLFAILISIFLSGVVFADPPVFTLPGPGSGGGGSADGLGTARDTGDLIVTGANASRLDLSSVSQTPMKLDLTGMRVTAGFGYSGSTANSYQGSQIFARDELDATPNGTTILTSIILEASKGGVNIGANKTTDAWMFGELVKRRAGQGYGEWIETTNSGSGDSIGIFGKTRCLSAIRDGGDEGCMGIRWVMMDHGGTAYGNVTYPVSSGPYTTVVNFSKYMWDFVGHGNLIVWTDGQTAVTLTNYNRATRTWTYLGGDQDFSNRCLRIDSHNFLDDASASRGVWLYIDQDLSGSQFKTVAGYPNGSAVGVPNYYADGGLTGANQVGHIAKACNRIVEVVVDPNKDGDYTDSTIKFAGADWSNPATFETQAATGSCTTNCTAEVFADIQPNMDGLKILGSNRKGWTNPSTSALISLLPRGSTADLVFPYAIRVGGLSGSVSTSDVFVCDRSLDGSCLRHDTRVNNAINETAIRVTVDDDSGGAGQGWLVKFFYDLSGGTSEVPDLRIGYDITGGLKRFFLGANAADGRDFVTAPPHTDPGNAGDVLIFDGTNDVNRGWHWQSLIAAIANYLGPSLVCPTGLVRGGGYDSVADVYQWVCANYNWTAHFGGFPDYNTPTTAVGNSWLMNCTGDGVATGNPIEETSCLRNGEQVHMYMMGDFMIAMEHVVEGGKMYLPLGIWHDFGCGRSGPTSQVANGCPVLRSDPTKKQRVIQEIGGRQYVGFGRVMTDFAATDGVRSGTFLISDRGPGGGTDHADKDPSEPTSPLCSTGTAEGCATRQTSFLVGFGADTRFCEKSDVSSTGPCVLRSGGITTGTIGADIYGFSTQTINNQSAEYVASNGLCTRDDPTTFGVGVCDGNPLIRCNASGSTRTGTGFANTGGCGVYGTCRGVPSMLEQDLQNKKERWVQVVSASCGYDGTCDLGNGSQAPFYAKVSGVGGACATGGRSIMVDQWPYEGKELLSGAAVHVVDYAGMQNEGGGYTNMTIAPAHWFGRDSTNDAGDCLTQSDPACDGGELVSHGATGGGLDNVSVLHANGAGSGGWGYAAFDGVVVNAYGGHIRDSLIAYGHGLISDSPAGFIFERNSFIDNTCGEACLQTGWGNNQRILNNIFYRNSGNALFSDNTGHGLVGRDNSFISNYMAYGLFLFRGGGKILWDGITGYGNRGRVAVFSPLSGFTIHDVAILNVMLTGQQLDTGFADEMLTPLAFTDYNGTTSPSYTSGALRHITIGGWSIESTTPNGCGIGLDGGTGDNLTPDNGQNRTIDQQRRYIDIQDYAFYTHNAAPGTPQMWCLGNWKATQGDAATRIADIWGGVRGIPSWRRLSIDGVPFVDKVTQDILSGQAGDAGTLPQGVRVTITNDTTPGACFDPGADGNLDGGGTARSTCVADPRGNGGDGEWVPDGAVAFLQPMHLDNPAAAMERHFRVPKATTLLGMGCTAAGGTATALTIKTRECDQNVASCTDTGLQVVLDAADGTRADDIDFTGGSGPLVESTHTIQFVVVSGTAFPTEVSCDVYGRI